MGKSGGGGTNTVVQNSQPPQYIADAYQQVYNQAQNVANAPLQQYQGNIVAGFTPDQLAAFQTISNAQGTAQPYINQANNYLAASTQPFNLPTMSNDQVLGYGNQAAGLFQGASQGVYGQLPQYSQANVNQYYNPYQNDVINSSLALINNQNAQQLQQQKGNQIASGAFGGDRAAVQDALLGGQQALAANSTIANLENQGFGQAQQQFNTQQNLAASTLTADQQRMLAAGQGFGGLFQGEQQYGLGSQQAQAWLNSNAGYQSGALGSEAQNSALSGASALLQSGALQQQQNQANLNVPYYQFLQQQAYPFQTTQYLANIALGTGAGAGGTSTTTSPGPSTLSQIGGLGLTGLSAASMMNGLGMFGGGTGLAASMASVPGWYATDAAAMDAGSAAGIDWFSSAAPEMLAAQRGGRIGHVKHRDGRFYADGGGVYDDMPIPAAGLAQGLNPAAGGDPQASGMYQKFANMPEEKLQEVVAGSPPGSTQGMMARKALAMKRMGVGGQKLQGFADGGDADEYEDDSDTSTTDVIPSFMPAAYRVGDNGPSMIGADNDSGFLVPARSSIPGGSPRGIGGGFPAPSASRGNFGVGRGASNVTGDQTNGTVDKLLNDPAMIGVVTGLGMMAGRSPYAGVNFGNAGLEGIKFAQSQQAARTAERKQEADETYRQAMLNKPTVSHDGEHIQLIYPNGETFDTGIPSSTWQNNQMQNQRYIDDRDARERIAKQHDQTTLDAARIRGDTAKSVAQTRAESQERIAQTRGWAPPAMQKNLAFWESVKDDPNADPAIVAMAWNNVVKSAGVKGPQDVEITANRLASSDLNAQLVPPPDPDKWRQERAQYYKSLFSNALNGQSGPPTPKSTQANPGAPPPSTPGMPPLPDSLKGKAGVQWNGALGQFRDGEGNLYNSNGDPL